MCSRVRGRERGTNGLIERFEGDCYLLYRQGFPVRERREFTAALNSSRFTVILRRGAIPVIYQGAEGYRQKLPYTSVAGLL